MINPSDIREILFNISKKTILPRFGNLNKNQISYKNGIDIVSDVDIDVELQLNHQLSKLLKNSCFIGEETYSKNPSILDYYLSDNYCWTVDPIDGTNNFVKSNNKFAVMIALTRKNKIIQSFIYKPVDDDFIYADSNGTCIDGSSLILKDESKLNNAKGSISIKYWDNTIKDKIFLIKDFFEKINSYGSIGCEYVDIVLGKRNFALLSRLYPWDHIPGVFIVRQAGGHDCHFNKLQYKFYEKSKNLIVSNSKKLNYEIINLIEEK